MIDTKISDLPCVLLSSCVDLPKTRGIYFVVSLEEQIIYIGQAIGLQGFYGRWKKHHLPQKLDGKEIYKIHYLEVNVDGDNTQDRKKLKELEGEFIRKYLPPFNKVVPIDYSCKSTTWIADYDWSEFFEQQQKNLF